MSHQDVEELDKSWGIMDEVLSDAALYYECARDENAECVMVVLLRMQLKEKGEEKSLFVVDNMYVWLIELDSPYIGPKLTIRSRNRRLR